MIDRIKDWLQKNFSRKNVLQWLKAFGIAIAIVGGFVGLIWLFWLVWEWLFVSLLILAIIISAAGIIKRYFLR